MHEGKKTELDDELTAIEAEVTHELEHAQQADVLDLQQAIYDDPYKLFYFTVRVINAIANSFMGVPAAAIIIAADRILSGTLTATLSTPDKIFILLLASAILMTFLTLAYKSEASTKGHQELSITIEKLVDMARLINIPNETIQQAQAEAKCEKMIIAIRNGALQESLAEGDEAQISKVFATQQPYLQILINSEIILHAAARTNPELYNILYRALYVEGYTYENKEVIQYIDAYKDLDETMMKENPKHWELIKTKFHILLEKITAQHQYKNRFYEIGNALGNVNALVNGILACSFGIGGLTAFFMLFVPGFSIPLAAAIPIAIILFIAGTIHSGTTTKAFIKNSFANFGLGIDQERLQHPENTTYDWLQFILRKIQENKKSLAIAAIASATVTGLCMLATLLFFGTLPISTPIVMAIVATVATLTWVSAFNSFHAVLMQKAQEDKDKQWYINTILSEDSREKLANAKRTKTYHAIFSAMATFIMLLITVPVMYTSSGLLMPLMISSTIGIVSYLATALLYSKEITEAQEPNEKTPLQIFNYRFRLIVAIVLGASFALTAGPTLASSLVTALPMVGSGAIIPIAISMGLIVAASLYYVMPLVYWNIALKPSYGFTLNPPSTESPRKAAPGEAPTSSTPPPAFVKESPHNSATRTPDASP